MDEEENEQKEVKALDRKDIEILKTYVCLISINSTNPCIDLLGKRTLPQ